MLPDDKQILFLKRVVTSMGLVLGFGMIFMIAVTIYRLAANSDKYGHCVSGSIKPHVRNIEVVNSFYKDRQMVLVLKNGTMLFVDTCNAKLLRKINFE